MSLMWLLIGVVGASFILTSLLRQYAISSSLLDIPGHRSSHLVPTPRGGGVAIVITFLLVLPVLVLFYWLDIEFAVAYGGAGLLVAVIGFLDDHDHIQARWRLLIHFLAAAWGLYFLGGLPLLNFAGIIIDLGWAGHFLASVYLVWLLNLYNFMDGINGIAGVEAVTVCLAGAGLYCLYLPDGLEWIPPLTLAAAVLGFLFWNFPRAKIFMGDAGSGFVGIVLGVFSIHAAWVSMELFWAWLILLGVFIVDATITLIRRVIRGEKFHEAHRSHAYQFAARKHQSHVKVTVCVGLVNILWLAPVAYLAVVGILDGFVAFMLAYLPLVLLAIKYKAGMHEANS